MLLCDAIPSFTVLHCAMLSFAVLYYYFVCALLCHAPGSDPPLRDLVSFLFGQDLSSVTPTDTCRIHKMMAPRSSDHNQATLDDMMGVGAP